MINPYFVYIFAFIIPLILYQLNWSYLYPTLSFSLLLFILFTIVVALWFGSLFKKNIFLKYIDTTYSPNISKITLFNYFVWTADMAYCQIIPLLSTLKGESYFYTDFTGIPTIHVFIATFQSFFCTYLFHMFISTKLRKVLYFYIINLLPFLLIFSRGGLLMVLVSSLFVYLSSHNERIFTTNFFKIFVLRVTPVALVFLIGFGSLGNIRNTSQLGGDSTDAGAELILTFGEVTPGFLKSGLPQELFWTYLYASSPLANLQENINFQQTVDINLPTIVKLTIDELMPDFISKRLLELMGLERRTVKLISPAWTTTTTYAGSYRNLSWLGLMIMASFIMIFPLLYISLLSQYNNFSVAAIATLNTLYLFLIFDNMFSVSSMSLQLVYPLLLSRMKIMNSMELQK